MQCGSYKALAVFLESTDYLLGTLNKTRFGFCCKSVVQHSTDSHVKPQLLQRRCTGLVPALLGSYFPVYCLSSDREFSLMAQSGQPSSTNTIKQAQLSCWTLFAGVSQAQSHCASLRNSFVTGTHWHLTQQWIIASKSSSGLRFSSGKDWKLPLSELSTEPQLKHKHW